MAKKVRRSRDAYYRKMIVIWIVALFFLGILVVLDIITVVNERAKNDPLSAELDYSKISFEGLAIDKVPPLEVVEHRVIDADFNYSWENISVSTDNNNVINRLAFYTTGSGDGGSTINDVSIDYRGYPLKTASDFAMFFGQTKVSNFGHYKYLKYGDDRYGLDLTLMDDVVYNVVLYKK